MSQILVLHSSSGASWTREREGILKFSKSEKWRIQVVDQSLERFELTELIDFWHPDGIIAECGADEGGVFSPLAFGKIPVVYIVGDVAKLPSKSLRVNHDADDIGKLAARGFLSSGIENFAFYGFSELYWSKAREKAFQKMLQLNGCEAYVFERHLREKLHAPFAQWLKSLEKPCGLLCANDSLALEAIELCEKLKIAVPDDISILGIDNDEMTCENSTPSISSIRPNFEEAGFLAAQLLAEVLHKGRKGNRQCDIQRYFGSFGIVRRASTLRLKRNDPVVTQALEIIRRRACDGLQPKDVAAELTVSRRTAEMRFRQLLGHSILDEICLVRLEKVKELLMRDNIPLESIAAQCGWKSTARLRVFFKKAEGVSMSEWRGKL